MTDDKQLERMRQAVEDKNEEARNQEGDPPEAPEELEPTATAEDAPDERAKSSRHGHVTADKWNQ
jgi:hypothetical protein